MDVPTTPNVANRKKRRDRSESAPDLPRLDETRRRAVRHPLDSYAESPRTPTTASLGKRGAGGELRQSFEAARSEVSSVVDGSADVNRDGIDHPNSHRPRGARETVQRTASGRSTNKDVETVLGNLEKDNADLKERLLLTKRELYDSKSVIRRHTAERAELKAKHDASLNDLERAHQESFGNFEAEQARKLMDAHIEKTQLVAQSKDRVGPLERELEETRRERDTLATERRQLIAADQVRDERLREWESEMQKREERVREREGWQQIEASYKKQLAFAKKEVDEEREARLQAEELQRQLELDRKTTIEDDKRYVREELEQLERKVRTLANDNKNKDTQIKRDEELIVEREAEIEKRVAVEMALETRHQQLLDDSKRTYQQLEMEHQSLKQEKVVLEKNVASKEAEIAKAKEIHEDAKADVTALEEEIQRLQDELEEVERDGRSQNAIEKLKERNRAALKEQKEANKVLQAVLDAYIPEVESFMEASRDLQEDLIEQLAYAEDEQRRAPPRLPEATRQVKPDAGIEKSKRKTRPISVMPSGTFLADELDFDELEEDEDDTPKSARSSMSLARQSTASLAKQRASVPKSPYSAMPKSPLSAVTNVGDTPLTSTKSAFSNRRFTGGTVPASRRSTMSLARRDTNPKRPSQLHNEVTDEDDDSDDDPRLAGEEPETLVTITKSRLQTGRRGRDSQPQSSGPRGQESVEVRRGSLELNEESRGAELEELRKNSDSKRPVVEALRTESSETVKPTADTETSKSGEMVEPNQDRSSVAIGDPVRPPLTRRSTSIRSFGSSKTIRRSIMPPSRETTGNSESQPDSDDDWPDTPKAASSNAAKQLPAKPKDPSFIPLPESPVSSILPSATPAKPSTPLRRLGINISGWLWGTKTPTTSAIAEATPAAPATPTMDTISTNAVIPDGISPHTSDASPQSASSGRGSMQDPSPIVSTPSPDSSDTQTVYAGQMSESPRSINSPQNPHRQSLPRQASTPSPARASGASTSPPPQETALTLHRHRQPPTPTSPPAIPRSKLALRLTPPGTPHTQLTLHPQPAPTPPAGTRPSPRSTPSRRTTAAEEAVHLLLPDTPEAELLIRSVSPSPASTARRFTPPSAPAQDVVIDLPGLGSPGPRIVLRPRESGSETTASAISSSSGSYRTAPSEPRGEGSAGSSEEPESWHTASAQGFDSPPRRGRRLSPREIPLPRGSSQDIDVVLFLPGAPPTPGWFMRVLHALHGYLLRVLYAVCGVYDGAVGGVAALLGAIYGLAQTLLSIPQSVCQRILSTCGSLGQKFLSTSRSFGGIMLSIPYSLGQGLRSISRSLLFVPRSLQFVPNGVRSLSSSVGSLPRSLSARLPALPKLPSLPRVPSLPSLPALPRVPSFPPFRRLMKQLSNESSLILHQIGNHAKQYLTKTYVNFLAVCVLWCMFFTLLMFQWTWKEKSLWLAANTDTARRVLELGRRNLGVIESGSIWGLLVSGVVHGKSGLVGAVVG